MKGGLFFMKLSELFKMQEKFINNVSKIDTAHEQDVKYGKILALQVKIAEIANETKCFKRCKSKNNFNKDILLKKYTDCLYIMISIGFNNNFIPEEIFCKTSTFDLTAQFENLYIDINDFVVCSSLDHYITLFEDFISLGNSLNFDEIEIINSCINNNVAKQ